MDIVLSKYSLQIILQHAAELGAIQTLSKIGRLKPYLKKSEAFRLYGRHAIESWIEDGSITPRKDGNDSAAWRIDRMEVETLVRSNELFRLLNI